MSAGDIINSKRVRIEANERLDTVDVDALSRTALDVGDAIVRSVVASPRATVASPIGLIISGFTLTVASPAGANKIRIDAAPGVAIDSNGRTLIKPTGTIDVTIPSGGPYQVYIYYQETTGDNAKRRFLSVTSPYAETARAVDTTFNGGIGTYVRSGGLGSTVASDLINGQTQALCLLAIATNPSGTAVVAGWNATTAPNGTDITNRLTQAVAPITPPVSPYINGSVKSVVDLVQNLIYLLGQTLYKGSAGAGIQVAAGTATAIGTNSLTDGAASYTVNAFSGGMLKDSTGVTFPITSHTATVFTLVGSPAAGAYTVHLPRAANNYGAFIPPTFGVEHVADLIVSTMPLNNLSVAGEVVADLAMAIQRNIVLQGTGYIKHGYRTFTRPITFALSSGVVYYNTAIPGAQLPASSTNYIPIVGLEPGQHVQSVTVLSLSSANATDYAIVDDTGGAFSAAYSGSLVGSGSSSATIPAPFFATANVNQWIKITVAAGTTRTVFAYSVFYDKP